MKFTDCTRTIENGMRFRHDTQARFTVTSGKTVLEDGLTSIDTLGGAMTRASIIYNRLSYSGGVSWWNPATGKELPRAPKVRMRVRPQDVLTGDQECGCDKCKETYGPQPVDRGERAA
jgi:hypothetical protein